MSIKEKILKRSKSFFENNLPEERFNILMTIKEKPQFDFDSLELVDIYVDSKADAHNITKVQTFVHIFKLNNSVILEIDVLEDATFIRDVGVHGDYFYSFIPATNEGEFFRNGDVNDYGLCDVLDAIEYSTFFNEEYDLLAELVSSVIEEEAKNLFIHVRDSYPGLVNITSGDSPEKFILHFSTDAELVTTRDSILSGHRTAQSKTKII